MNDLQRALANVEFVRQDERDPERARKLDVVIDLIKRQIAREEGSTDHYCAHVQAEDAHIDAEDRG